MYMRVILYSIPLLLCAACSSVPPSHNIGETRSNSNVTSYAKSLIGVPYHYGGDSPRTGFDCSGFVRHVFYHSLGVSLPHNARDISRAGKPVRTADLRPGDLVFYDTLSRAYSHVGIYLGSERFIHAPSSGKRVEIVDMGMDYWRKRYNGARRITQYR
jgi:cell wall-associated NlpC family hydrolase